MPLRCGRLDRHEPHEWTRHSHLEGGFGPVAKVPGRTYMCSGHVITEGGYTRDADKAQDEYEERAIRERREVV